MSDPHSERDYRRAASAMRAIKIVDNIRRQARTFTHTDPSAAIIRQRTRLEKSLAKWLRYYMKDAFALQFGSDHLAAIAKLETAIKKGGMFALAMARGSGKTTICRAAAMFAVLTGARAYVLFVAATQTDAEAAVEFIRHQLLENEVLAKHYPHVAVYVQAGEDKANRAKFQLRTDGKSTGLRWSKSGLTLPAGISDQGKSGYLSDGAIIEASGLTGSIRGKARDGRGKVIRPDFVVMDDCQTRESAESPSQCAARERIISGDIMALAGPRKKIACAAVSTIIKKGDLADRLLDRKLHPEFSGSTYQLIHAWPTAQETLWQQYAELYKSGLADGDTREAFDYYKLHRAEMDAGAEVSWPARIRKGEISALQTAENLQIEMGKESFMAELMLAPIDICGSQYELTPEMVMAHAVNTPRLHLPELTTVFVGSIDINRAGLHWCMAGFDQTMTGHCPAYGKHPQHGDLWERNAPELQRKQAIFHGLKTVCDQIAATTFMRGAQRIQPSLILVDLGFEALLVHRFCNSAAYPFKVIPSAGRAAHKYYIKRDALIGRPYEGCHVQKSDNGPYLIFNADHFRETMQKAFLADPGAPGGFTLFQAPEKYHVTFAEHVTAEKLTNKYETDQGVRWEWRHQPGAVWDLGDAVSGCWASAAASGLSTSGTPPPAPTKKAHVIIRRPGHHHMPFIKNT